MIKFTNDSRYLICQNKKIRVGQPEMVVHHSTSLNNFNEGTRFVIEDEIILNNFIIPFGLTVVIDNKFELNNFRNKLLPIATILNDIPVTYCVTEYNSFDNWKAYKLKEDGLLDISNNLTCKDGIIQ